MSEDDEAGARNDGLEGLDNNYKKKFIFTLIALIVVTIIFAVAIILLIVLRKKTSSDSDTVWKELPGDEVLENVYCVNNEKDINSKFSQNLWNTPKRGDKRWKKGFQDMNVLVGYPQLKYSEDLKKCTVTVFTKTAIELKLKYYFDDVAQDSNVKEFDESYKKILKIKVKAETGEILELEDVDFYWNIEQLGNTKFDTKGQKGAIVEMYGWSDKDIEKECKFIGEQGYLGVKVFPHHEQVMSDEPFREQLNPWYYMYQPVSYSLNGRLGTRDDFRQMIKTCRQNGVRVYADAVINHMTYNGFDLQKHRFTGDYKELEGEKYSSGESPYWTPFQTYEINPYTKRGTNALEYPAVPYGPMDFHCQRLITNYKDFDNVMFGWLDNLADLNTESTYVRQRIADYLTDLFSIGLSGFRLDAAKHIKPKDIAEILAIFKSNIGGKFPDDFFTWLEILAGDEAEILFAEDGENSYAGGLDKSLKNLGFNDEDILKVKIWWASYPKNYTVDMGTVDPRRKVIQNDDHDTQYADYRGLTEVIDGKRKGCVLSAGCEAEEHRNHEKKLFSEPYGVEDNKNDSPIRMILSSFYMNEGVAGLPDGKSDCEKNCIKNCDNCKKYSLPYFPGYLEDGKAYSGEGFSRVHRDEEIIKAMQDWMNL